MFQAGLLVWVASKLYHVQALKVLSQCYSRGYAIIDARRYDSL